MPEPLSPVSRVVALFATWLLWVLPFMMRRMRGRPAAQKIDRRARWGISLTGIGFGIAYMHRPQMWAAPLPVWRLALGLALAAVSIALSWVAVGNLGKQWRIDAGLNSDHEMVTEGAYKIVRHPIYASMFGMLLAALALMGSMPGAAIGVALFAVGTEIRIRVEDGLLQERFGARFTAWQRSKAAWIPFIR